MMPDGPPPPPTILSWVPGRHGRSYKMHDNIGHAKSAVISGHGGKIYEWVNNEWVELYDVPTGQGWQNYKKENMPWNKERSDLEKARREERNRLALKRAAIERMKEIENLW